MIICIQNLVLICQFVFKILSKNLILSSIKGCNSVANLTKFEPSKLSRMSSLPARIKKIQSKMKALECAQDSAHYRSMGIFRFTQEQLTP